MQEISSLFRSGLSKIKAPPGWAVLLGITLASCWYILNLTGESFISVPEIELRLELPFFQRLEMEFTKPVHIKSCILGRPEIYTRVKPASAKTGHDMAVEGALTTLKLENYYTNQLGPLNQIVQPMTISLASGDHVEIARVSIDEQPVALEKFLELHLKNKASITRIRYFRHAFAQILLPLNDVISNWVLTFGFFWTVWTCAGVIMMELKAYVYPSSLFVDHIKSASGEKDLAAAAARKRASDRCADLWSRRDTRYKYQQALGPAAGFIMTVASLIYSLSSSKVDVQLLIGGMHIAMVSTFLGLFLRIAALEGERVSFRLFEREVKELEALSEKEPETELAAQ